MGYRVLMSYPLLCVLTSLEGSTLGGLGGLGAVASAAVSTPFLVKLPLYLLHS